MSAFLFSFTAANREHGLVFESHIYEIPRPPTTAQSLTDIEMSLGIEYGLVNTTILNWDYLPDHSNHPGRDNQHPYALTYNYAYGKGGYGFGRIISDYTHPIVNQQDLRSAEEELRRQNGFARLRLIGCKPLQMAY